MRFVEADALRRLGQIPDGDGLTLRVEGPVMRLQGPGEDRLLITDPVPGARFYKARINGVSEARMAGRGWEWDGGFSLRPHLSCTYQPRDWAWAWTPTYGPVILNIYLERTLAESEEWLASLAPHGYEPFERPGHYHWGDSRLTLRDGRVRFSRGYLTPPAAVQWVDAGLLCSLLSHELTWDLMDGDYLVWTATGHTAASFANYLRAGGSADRGEWEWPVVDAGAASDDTAIARALQEFFGVPPGAAAPEYFRNTPVPELPRKVTIKLPRAMHATHEDSILLRELVNANERILWSFEFSG